MTTNPGTRILSAFTSCLNQFATRRAAPTNVPSPAATPTTETVDLTAAFDELVGEYNRSGKLPDPSLLVCECMRQGVLGMLRQILALKDLRGLCIQGPMDAQGWETFFAALPGEFPLVGLTLSNLTFDRPSVDLLFQAMQKMPALGNLLLFGVEALSGVTDASQCPALTLKTLNVVEAGVGQSGAVQDGKVSVCPLLVNILERCQVRNLTLMGLRFEVQNKGNRKLKGPVVPFDQNERLGAAIRRQPELAVLRIKNCRALAHHHDGVFSIDYVEDSGHLVQITPVYKVPSLRLLDLDRNLLPASTTTAILRALVQDGASLRHLNLNGNFIENETVRAMRSLLESKSLVSVSFLQDGLDEYGDNPKHLVDEGALQQLTQAVEQRTSLRRLEFQGVPGLDRIALDVLLYRNRQIFKTSVLKAGLGMVMRPLPKDAVDSFVERAAGYLNRTVADRDALNASSVNQAAWRERQHFLQSDQPPN